MKYTIKDFLEVKGASSPSLSLNGQFVAFLSNQTGTSQLYIVSSKGGQSEQITSYADSLQFAQFSPTKNEVIFSKDENGNEQFQLYIYSLDTKEIRSLTSRSDCRYSFGTFSDDGLYISYSHNERNGKDFDTYIKNLETGEDICIYNEGGLSYGAGFSHDNAKIVIKKSHANFNTDLYICDIATKQLELITKHEGDIYFGGATWLPGDLEFSVRTNKDKDFFGLSKYNLAQKTLTPVLNPEWDIDNHAMSVDGKYIKVIINEGGYYKFRLYKTENLEEVALQGFPECGMIYDSGFSQDSKFIVLHAGGACFASDIWMYSIEEKKSWRITESFQGVPSDVLVEPELISFNSFDGLKIPAFVYKPKEIPTDKKLPVIIHIHGGPESQFVPSITLLIQYFVYYGYAVIAPNVRGSAGYGKKYLAMDDVEKRLDSVNDLASLHDHIKTMPDLDANKVALMGGSYGGYMTLAGLAFHPERWAGGIDIVGISNFITFLKNTAPYRRGLREAEYGSLEKNYEFLEKVSPINHIEKMKAPLFIIHGTHDPRVPLNEAEQIVEKMKSLGRHAELLVYEDEGHGLSKLKNRLDAYPKVLKFLEEIFK